MENINIQLGVVLEAKASELTQGLPGKNSETYGFIRHK